MMIYSEVGKMLKLKFNVINLDDVVVQYGVDCFWMYEMFLGFIEQAKFWDIQGIDGVYKFLCWFYDLFFDKDGYFMVSNKVLDKVEFKVLYQAIQKVEQDIECFFFNICVSVFMIVINELCKMKCNK